MYYYCETQCIQADVEEEEDKEEEEDEATHLRRVKSNISVTQPTTESTSMVATVC